ncbi:MAG: TylF/MycF family methyltransferase [Kiritimatiellae bacterium]|nr:TylF/MycF family methyltransferase [Kiritimatiellia bacterium]
MGLLRSAVTWFVARVGPAVARYAGQPRSLFPPDLDDEAIEVIRAVSPFTMTSVPRLFALIEATRYVIRTRIEGEFVECGVWRGGSMMAVALALLKLGVRDRHLFLFDTYEGMPEPGALDVSFDGLCAHEEYKRRRRRDNTSTWCYASLEEVRKNLSSTGYDMQRVHLIKGKVEETIPSFAPDRVAVLRLDTDWYSSTRHELEHLYPRLSVGGVLIVDDYGYWRGSRQAVDEYFAGGKTPVLLNRIDHTGRIAVKWRSDS